MGNRNFRRKSNSLHVSSQFLSGSSEIKVKERNNENSIEKGGNGDGCGWMMMDDARSSIDTPFPMRLS